MEEKYPEETLANEIPKVKEKKRNKKKEKKKLDPKKEKLKRYYQSQDKLAPLFDDPEQSINTCYIRLALLTQQQFQQQKYKMINNEKKENSEEDKKYEDYIKENGKWPNPLDYSLIYRNQTENIELQDIWNDKENESK
ncbi:hypothetical protein RFI_26391, partial [Reticulomyxa filosa]